MDSSMLTRPQSVAQGSLVGYFGSKTAPQGIRPVQTRATRRPSRVQAQIVNASSADKWQMETQAVHVGDHEHIAGAAITPIFQSATYLFDGDTATGKAEVKYARCNNTPNHHALAAKVAALENTEGAMVTSSGMTAISTTILTLMKAGDHMLVQTSLYGATEVLFTDDFPEWGITCTRVDADKPETWAAAMKPNTKVFFVESISNPLLEMPDFAAVVSFCKEKGLTSVIDNTFASPAIFRPADMGFDVVCESATKYLNGHSDVIAGSVAGKADFMKKFNTKLAHLGGSLDPHACFLLQRGLKTLPLRVRQQCANALAIAQFLQDQPQVSKVVYPALPDHAYFPRVQQLFGGNGGGVVSFELTGGAAAADLMCQKLKIPLVAVSLGGVESLITRPAATTHAMMTQAERERCGIADGLIRLACGIEAADDLIQDLQQALASIGGTANGSSNGTKKANQAVKKSSRGRASSNGASRNGASSNVVSTNGALASAASANRASANGKSLNGASSSGSSSGVNGAGVQHNKEILREV